LGMIQRGTGDNVKNLLGNNFIYYWNIILTNKC